MKCICNIAVLKSTTSNFARLVVLVYSPPPLHCLVAYGMFSTLVFVKGGFKSLNVKQLCICLKASNNSSAYGWCSVCSHWACCYIVWLCIVSFVTSDLQPRLKFRWEWSGIITGNICCALIPVQKVWVLGCFVEKHPRKDSKC